MAEKQLEQLNAEIASLYKKGDAVEKEWLAATDPQERAALWELYTDARFERRQLDARRAALEADLVGTGEQTPLLPFQQLPGTMVRFETCRHWPPCWLCIVIQCMLSTCWLPACCSHLTDVKNWHVMHA